LGEIKSRQFQKVSELEIRQVRQMFHKNKLGHLNVDEQQKLKAQREALNVRLKKQRKLMESKKGQRNADLQEAFADSLQMQGELMRRADGFDVTDPAQPASSSAGFTEEAQALRERIIIDELLAD
jgi:hypothetical protein